MKSRVFLVVLILLAGSVSYRCTVPTKKKVTRYPLEKGLIPTKTYYAKKKYYANPDDIYNSNSCKTCHDERMHLKFKHQAAKISCRNCHVGHGNYGRSSLPHQLTDKAPKMCLDCHKHRPLHMNNVEIKNHPMKGEHDYIDHKAEFNCLSCHDPHSSNRKNLFRYDFGKDTPYRGSLCALCHWGDVFDGRPPAKPTRRRKPKKLKKKNRR